MRAQSLLSSRALRAVLATLVPLAAALSASAAEASPALRVVGRHFVDDGGRVVVLRGVNVGNAKVPPFRPVTGPAFFNPVAAWGMNVVRLPFTWEAYEAARGTYDAAYLDYYASAVDAAASRGLFVVVDVHQDAFSRFSLGGCGDGMPSWAIPTWIPRATPSNGSACADWGTRMLLDATMHASWNGFHGDAGGARTRYLAMIESVARHLASRRAVVGYDMMNEPWGDEPTELRALYEDAGAAIRRADPSAILFVSPHALTSAGTRSNLPRPSFQNIAFAQHFYDPGVVVTHGWSGSSLDGSFANLRGVAEAWGVPLFVGEFGAPEPTTNGTAYVAALYDGLDATIASGAQWVYTPSWTAAAKDGWNAEDLSVVDGAGATRANFVARPYPRRVSGTPTRFAMTGTTAADRAVELAWDNAPQTGETEIYVPAQALFGGAMAADAVGAQLTCTAAGTTVRCASPASGAMRVRIHASAPPPPPPPPTGCARAGGEAVAIPAVVFFVSARRRRARRDRDDRGAGGNAIS